MNIMSASGDFIQLAGICLDRLLKQRSALRKPIHGFLAAKSHKKFARECCALRRA